MRYLLVLLALCLGLSSVARAQEDDLDAFIKRQRDAALAAEGAPDLPTTRQGKLDWLFGELQKAKEPAIAQQIAAQIIVIFNDSGSDTVALLMSRANKAITDKNDALALDLLDQVITLKPDYVEGWNKRATVYFNETNYGQALADIERVLRLEPRHFGALSGLGMILGEMDDTKHAIEVFQWVLGIYPQLDNAKKALDDLQKEVRERSI